MWSVTRALNPVMNNGERVTRVLRTQVGNYDWNDLDGNIENFEIRNNIGISLI
jgi:hypothetical protein